MAGRKSTLQDIFEIFLKFTDFSWRVGIVITFFLLFLSYQSFVLVDSIVADGKGRLILAILEKLSWGMYLLPFILLLTSAIIASKAFIKYSNEKNLERR